MDSHKTTTIQGKQIPSLGLGTWQMTGGDCERAVQEALSIGYRHIDTAQMYENEAEVGRGLKASKVPRDQIFLTTKLSMGNVGAERVRSSTEQSLSSLQSEYVDLLLIHWPSKDIPLGETLEAMKALQRDGRVRHIGVSNFPPSWLDAALKVAPIFCNQVEHHVYFGQSRLRGMACDKDLLLTAYSPLARGKVHKDELLLKIGEAHGKSPSQVALRWLIQHPKVVAIPKSSQRKHLEANFDIFDFELNKDEMSQIADLDRGERLINPDWAPDWED